MNRSMQTQVLIAGAGPVGLTLAIDLAWRGIDVVVVEIRRVGEPPRVRSNHVSARSMEIFRRLGLAKAIRVEGSSLNLAGVSGFSSMDVGVFGRSETVSGVLGTSDMQNGVFGICGPPGPPVPNTSDIAGVVGTSDQQHGVIGTSNAAVGVIGFSNNIGVLGYTATPGAVAGQFIGDLQVTGTKAAVVPFPDGTASRASRSPTVS